jgi:ribosomal protein L35
MNLVRHRLSPRKETDPFFILGGVVVPEDIWWKLDTDLKRLKARFKITGEIKWRYFAPGKEENSKHALSHLSAKEKESLRTELYKVLCSYKSIRLVCVATNVSLAYGLPYIQTADDLYWYSYKQLTERFQYYLQDLARTVGQRVNGIIVCDHRQSRDDERLRELHHKMLTGGKE